MIAVQITSPSPARPASIADLNDVLRRSFLGGRVLLTPGVAALDERQQLALLAAVQKFDRFTADNDPHGEHDFGSTEHEGLTYFWKIDYYDADLTNGSPDPADPTVTTRVLTIMRADEY